MYIQEIDPSKFIQKLVSFLSFQKEREKLLLLSEQTKN